jgi:hypothetical protein
MSSNKEKREQVRREYEESKPALERYERELELAKLLKKEQENENKNK